MKKYLITLVLALLLVLTSSQIVLAWDNCPLGLENDSYPGSCNKYIDTNKDNICDLSQENPLSITDNQLIKNNTNTYNFIPITIITAIIYLLSYFLAKKEKISIITHKRIWNALLLLTFIVTALTSIVYLLNSDLGLGIKFPNLTFLHIELGLVMILISIFHAFWHLSYFKSYFSKK